MITPSTGRKKSTIFSYILGPEHIKAKLYRTLVAFEWKRVFFFTISEILGIKTILDLVGKNFSFNRVPFHIHTVT